MTRYGGDTTDDRRTALEQRTTATRVLQAFDDDGDGVLAGADLLTLEATLADADDVVSGILVGKGYVPEQLELLRTDRQIVRAWAGIAAQLMGERRPEWLEDGVGPFDEIGQRARSELTKLTRGEIRSVKEPDAGVISTISGMVDAREHFFLPNPDDPLDRGPGGF